MCSPGEIKVPPKIYLICSNQLRGRGQMLTHVQSFFLELARLLMLMSEWCHGMKLHWLFTFTCLSGSDTRYCSNNRSVPVLACCLTPQPCLRDSSFELWTVNSDWDIQQHDQADASFWCNQSMSAPTQASKRHEAVLQSLGRCNCTLGYQCELRT